MNLCVWCETYELELFIFFYLFISMYHVRQKPAECIEMTIWSRWFPHGDLDNLQQVSHDWQYVTVYLYICHAQLLIFWLRGIRGEHNNRNSSQSNNLPVNTALLKFIIWRSWFSFLLRSLFDWLWFLRPLFKATYRGINRPEVLVHYKHCKITECGKRKSKENLDNISRKTPLANNTH